MKRSKLTCVALALLWGAMLMTILPGPAFAQNPNSCTTSGFTGFSFTFAFDAMTNTTTYEFVIINRSPLMGIFVNIGEVFLFDIAAPSSVPTTPAGWEFVQVGPKLLYATTSNPWWQTPPSIKPGDSLGGYNYTIAGPPDLDFVIFTHVQPVTDASGQTSTGGATFFDCSVEEMPPQQEPCINICKFANPLQAEVGDFVTYTYDVCNCGNTNLTVTSIVDTNPSIGNLLPAFIAANGGSDQLGINECVMFSVMYQIQGTDPNPFENCVDIVAEDPDMNEVMDDACITVFILKPMEEPCIDITKSADPIEADVGQNVTYTYEVCNCGDVTLTVTSLVDTNPAVGNILPNFIAANGGSDQLDPQDCVMFSVVYQIQMSDPTPFFNCATVVGEGSTVEDSFCARVDINETPARRRCYLPVTLTQECWKTYCDPNNGIILGGLVFNKFRLAFARFTYFGTVFPNTMIVGTGRYRMTYFGTTGCLNTLCIFLPQFGACGSLDRRWFCPWESNSAGELAGQTIALMMNIAYNDERLMPRSPGYDLEEFRLARGKLKRSKVGDVLNIANAVLGGLPAVRFGLTCDELVEILQNINCNYGFVDFKTFTDNGYLIPNRRFGRPDPPHAPTVPFM